MGYYLKLKILAKIAVRLTDTVVYHIFLFLRSDTMRASHLQPSSLQYSSFLRKGGEKQAALILMKNYHFNRTPLYPFWRESVLKPTSESGLRPTLESEVNPTPLGQDYYV